jgi:hypothetical protein
MTSLANINNPAPSAGRPPRRLRILRVLSFLAIVWAIAGAFWSLFWGQIWLVDRVAQSDWVPGWMTASTVKPADCSAVVEGAPEARLGAASLKRTRRAAFEMGFALGATTALRNAGQVDTDQNRQARSAPASELGVPAPEMPRLQSASYALGEFRAHVTGDPQCIGALLAKLYSPRHDALYRFGAFVGHEVIYRVQLPELGPMFVPDLRRYGGAAGLPEEVWDLFVDPHADVRKALAGVNAYLQAEPPSQE